jgi:hypothetical protein
MSSRRPASSRRKEQLAATTREKVVAVLAFVAIMGGVYGVWWYLQRMPVRQFPSDIDIEIPSYLLSVPSGVIHFRFVNFTQLRTKTVGVEQLENGTLISLATPKLNLTTNDADWIEDIEVEEGVMASVLGMSPGSAAHLAGILTNATVARELLAGVITYRVRNATGGWGKLAIVGNLVVYSDQTSDPTSPVEKILTAITTGESRLFDNESVKESFYVATQGGPLFGLSYTHFYPSGQSEVDIEWMFSVVRYAGELIEEKNMFKLPSQQDAINEFDALKPYYFVKGQNPYIIGPLIVVQYDYSLEDLKTVVLSL